MIGRRQQATRRADRRWPVLVLCCALLPGPWPAGNAPAARAQEPTDEGRIMAAFVYNFCKVTTWPEEPADRLDLVVAGRDDVTAALLELDGRTLGRRSLAVRRLGDGAAPDSCHLLYLAEDPSLEPAAILAGLGRAPVLTIGTADGFCGQGGMIQLVRSRGRIRLLINNRAAEAAGLVFSSQLLKMATIVDER